MKMKTALCLAAALPLIVIGPMTAAQAETKPAATAAAPGAMPGDKAMTCEMIASERTGINDAVLATAAKKEKSAKVRKSIFGIAKGMATVMLPGAALLGGGSPLGSLAMQGASQGAANALAQGGNGAAKPAAAPEPTEEQAARLQRLDSIGAYRQCQA